MKDLESEERKRALSTIEYLQSKMKEGVLLEYDIRPLMNIETLEFVGISVDLGLSTTFVYTSTMLDDWKERFGAHVYSVSEDEHVLHVEYKVHFNPQA